MSMNALEQQSQVQEEFEYVYKSSQGLKRASEDELQTRWMISVWRYMLAEEEQSLGRIKMEELLEAVQKTCLRRIHRFTQKEEMAVFLTGRKRCEVSVFTVTQGSNFEVLLSVGQ